MKKTIVALAALTLASFASAQNVGFETGEGFTAGALSGQSGWTAGTGYSVATDKAHSGTQSAKWTNATGGSYAWFDLASPFTGSAVFSTWLWIDAATANADRIFGIRFWDGATGGANVTLASDGKVRGDGNSPWSSPTLATQTSVTGRWIQMSLAYTTGTTSAVATVDGTSYNLTGLTALTQITDADLHTDFINSGTTTGTGWFDDYSFGSPVPEPGTMALVGGLAALALRRRKK